jgi:glucokinase
MFLAGDIGGTKTNLVVLSPKAEPRAPLAKATFPSARYPSLEALVREFLSQVDLKVERASFGVAGPVVAGRVAVTNLPRPGKLRTWRATCYSEPKKAL